MGIQQSYARATISSNLKDDEHHHDHEKLAAVALAGCADSAPANLLFRLKYANDSSSYHAALNEWQRKVGVLSKRRRWPESIDHASVAKQSLDYWITDKCPVCCGRGHLPLPGLPNVLSDDPCFACHGTTIRKLDAKGPMEQYIHDMVGELNFIAKRAADAAMRKLRVDMEL